MTMFPKPTFKTKSERRSEQYEEYRQRRRQFLNQKKWCEIRVTAQCRKYAKVATDVHHTQGREGDRLLDESKWKAGCRDCHDFLHDNPVIAYRMGLLLRRN